MRIGIDLLWVRPGICGGTESFVRNLMDGFGQCDRENEYILFTAEDNHDSFESYDGYSNMKRHRCGAKCASQMKRILWENMNLDKEAAKESIDVMYIPVYSKPRTHGNGIPYVCTIHDLQALHYPEYFSFGRRCFLRYAWRHSCKTSSKVVVSSEFCRKDLIRHYPFVKERIVTIYDPIQTEECNLSFDKIGEKYGIESEGYYYCVSSMLPHKNLITVLKAMPKLSKKLVISGVGGRQEEFEEAVKGLGIEDAVIQTGFVSNEERDCLYENCKLFLFPSIFEGFGMPPIEAMRRGKRVVMTRKSCLEEVTEGKAVYVDNPTDPEEWISQIQQAEAIPMQKEAFEQYNIENVVRDYLHVLTECAQQKKLV